MRYPNYLKEQIEWSVFQSPPFSIFANLAAARLVGKHDDKVDVCALFGLMMDEMVSGRAPIIAPPRKKIDRWDKVFEEEEDFNWKTA